MGNTKAGAVVHFSVDGNAVADTATADANGNWTFGPAGLADGSHTVVASETDVSGQTYTDALTFTLDRTVISSDLLNKNGSFTLSGSSDAGKSIFLYDGTQSLGQTKAGADGSWSFMTAALPDVVHTFTATDVPNNSSASSGVAIYGTNGAETIASTLGNDLLTGAKGADTFVFAQHFGQDTITDFTPNGGSHDVLEFDGVFANAADALAHSQQVGHDVHIADSAGDTVTLAGVNLHQLSSSDFYIV